MPEQIPFDGLGMGAPWLFWSVLVAVVTLMLFVRYAVLAGLFEWWFKAGARSARYDTRVLKLGRRPDLAGNQQRQPWLTEQMRHEIRYAAATSFIFGLSTAVLLWGWTEGYLRLYVAWDARPLWWLPLSLLLAMLLHETYYYWLHRLMHHPRLYPWLHRGHHHSIHTSSWTSFAFDPGEALLQAAIIPVILMLVPMHLAVLVLWLMIMTISAIINHLGVELYPAGSYRHWFGRQWIGATHHGLHHTRFNKNYGLYFTFWDRWMGTEAEETLREFERYSGERSS